MRVFLLAPYVQTPVRLRCDALGICAEGELREHYGVLTFTGAPGLSLELGSIEWIDVAPIGPRPWAGYSDVAMRIGDMYVEISASSAGE